MPARLPIPPLWYCFSSSRLNRLQRSKLRLLRLFLPTIQPAPAKHGSFTLSIALWLPLTETSSQPTSRASGNCNAKTRELFPRAKSFAGLTSPQQIEILHAIEKTDFFELLRLHTIVGFFARPEYGGNHNQVGWKLIGLEDEMTYEPPFGYYDAKYDKGK